MWNFWGEKIDWSTWVKLQNKDDIKIWMIDHKICMDLTKSTHAILLKWYLNLLHIPLKFRLNLMYQNSIFNIIDNMKEYDFIDARKFWWLIIMGKVPDIIVHVPSVSFLCLEDDLFCLTIVRKFSNSLFDEQIGKLIGSFWYCRRC